MPHCSSFRAVHISWNGPSTRGNPTEKTHNHSALFATHRPSLDVSLTVNLGKTRFAATGKWTLCCWFTDESGGLLEAPHKWARKVGHGQTGLLMLCLVGFAWLSSGMMRAAEGYQQEIDTLGKRSKFAEARKLRV